MGYKKVSTHPLLSKILSLNKICNFNFGCQLFYWMNRVYNVLEKPSKQKAEIYHRPDLIARHTPNMPYNHPELW